MQRLGELESSPGRQNDYLRVALNERCSQEATNGTAATEQPTGQPTVAARADL